MLTTIIPKLPMSNKEVTIHYYVNNLDFKVSSDYGDYLIINRDNVELHFFEFKTLDPKENYGQVYIRTNEIDNLYQSLIDNNVAIHPNGKLTDKPWGQREFELLDPDHNLITFGQSIIS